MHLSVAKLDASYACLVLREPRKPYLTSLGTARVMCFEALSFRRYLSYTSTTHFSNIIYWGKIRYKLLSMDSLKDLMRHFPNLGRLERIMLRTAYRDKVLEADETEALAGIGLKGDHRDSKQANNKAKRQVTLIQAEHLPVIASNLGLSNLEPNLTRRNLLISGINLLALKESFFQIGEVVLEGTGPCHPCSRMEEIFGFGGYNAMRGHGGITARVIKAGILRVGDTISPIEYSVDPTP